MDRLLYLVNILSFYQIFFLEIFYVCCVVKTKFWKERKWFLMVSPHGAASGGEVVTVQSVDWRAGGFSWLSPGSCWSSARSRGWRRWRASRPTDLSTTRSCSCSSQTLSFINLQENKNRGCMVRYPSSPCIIAPTTRNETLPPHQHQHHHNHHGAEAPRRPSLTFPSLFLPVYRVSKVPETDPT